jgi:Holliday junction resolvase RusA-like endonuclease
MTYRFTIPGNPIAKHRPRFARRGKFTVTYNDQETEEGRWLWELKQQWREKPIEGPIQLEVAFYMPIPKYLMKKWATTPHVKKPDTDNLVKFLKDCCNQTLWKDDSQVWSIKAFKMYSPDPKTVVEIIY